MSNSAVETVNFDLSQSRVNVTDEVLLAQTAASIRRGHPQMVSQQAARPERIVLLGSGPSLNESVEAIRDLVFQGAKVVTVNGSYHWAIEHNFRPSAQVVLDPRADNARFLDPAVPDCAYLIASQCHPAVWDAVDGRERVWIFHPVPPEGPIADVLTAYYGRRWVPVMGGCTVTSRALWLMVMQGYLRFDFFGVDCCWRGDTHHAFDQPENAKDEAYIVTIEPRDHPEQRRDFTCSLWMMKQFEDLLQMIKELGDRFLLRVHGDGLLAYALATAVEDEAISITSRKE